MSAANIAIAGRERTTDKETDFKAILTKIKARNPDVVFYGGMDMTAGPMLKQARELGIKAIFAFGDGACTDEMAQLAGGSAKGMVCSQAGPPREAASPEFIKAFTAKFGKIQQYSPLYYDATNAVIEAMRKADSVEAGKFAPKIFNVSFSGATGAVQFDGKRDRRDAEMTAFQMVGGRIRPVATIKDEEMKPLSAH